MRQSSRKELRVSRGIAAAQSTAAPTELAEFEKTLKTAHGLLQSLFVKIDSDQIAVVDTNDLYKISNSLSGLTRALVEIQRWQAERHGFLDEAAEQIAAQFRSLLAERPELLEEILELLEESKERAVPQLPDHELT